MGAPGLNELKNKFALTPSSQTSSSGASLQVQLLPSILCTEGGPLAKFLGIVCPLMRGCLLNISLHHTWKLPTKTDSFSESSRGTRYYLTPVCSWGKTSGPPKETKRKWMVWFQDQSAFDGDPLFTRTLWEHLRVREGYSQGATEFLYWMESFDLLLMKIHGRMTSLCQCPQILELSPGNQLM